MIRESRILLLLVVLTLFSGCANVSSKQQVLAAGSQVEVRSYQTRTYDTNDKIRVMRAVMATLQDLRFVIDKADDTVGVVSATKLDGYALSISVSVRPSGEQMVVRANAQFNLKAIEEPGPYQDFFVALDRGLFLDNNMLAETQVAASQPPVTRGDTVQAEAPEVSVYAFYGEAEAEVNAGSQDNDLWARALVEVEGDEQKRKARYIELRAAEFYAQSPGAQVQQASSASRAVIRVEKTGSQSKSIGLSSQANSRAAKGESIYLVAGTYYASIKGDNLSEFSKRYRNENVSLAQSGNEITGSFADGGEIEGTLSGDTITFDWYIHHMEGHGEWKIARGGMGMTGEWGKRGVGMTGVWNLQKTDGPITRGNPNGSRSTMVELPADNLTGNYIDNNGNTVMIEHSGNAIKGSYGEYGGSIDGTLKGDVIEYKWEQQLKSNRRWVSGLGRLQVSADGMVLSGSWWDPSSSSRQGTWTLTKVGVARSGNREENLGAAMSSAIIDLNRAARGLSGTYVSEITTDTHWVFQNPQHRRLLVVFEQRGEDITAISDSANLKISATVDGDEISFFTWPSDITSSEIKGKWEILDDGARLEGKWTHPHGGGQWNLTRLNNGVR